MNRRHVLASAAIALGFGPGATAQAQLVNKYAEQLKNGEFNWFPERSPSGPLLIIVSIPDQLVHVYRNGIRVAASTCSTGKPGHGTPTGVFKILQKDKHHKSSTYSNAPMPNMNRLTWSGIALHAGKLPGYPASHGCVRLPLQFSEMLFGITKLGMTVVLADEHSQPASVVHPGLVLGEYAKHEFDAVDSSVKNNHASAHADANPMATSVVISGRDKSVTVFDGHKIVSSGRVTIAEEHKPLSRAIHTLHGTNPQTGELQWSSTAYGKGDREDLTTQIRRIQADRTTREAIRKRMHVGMTIMTTDESYANEHRSDPGFVVIDGLY
jgi:hypothetical protein